jgi:hypothetical protein
MGTIIEQDYISLKGTEFYRCGFSLISEMKICNFNVLRLVIYVFNIYIKKQKALKQRVALSIHIYIYGMCTFLLGILVCKWYFLQINHLHQSPQIL